MSRSEKTWKPPESVRIGPLPAHEAVQPAELGDQPVAGPEVQVVGVAEHDLRPERRAARPGVSVFTVAFVPTGMNDRRLDLAVRGREHPGARRPRRGHRER